MPSPQQDYYSVGSYSVYTDDEKAKEAIDELSEKLKKNVARLDGNLSRAFFIKK